MHFYLLKFTNISKFTMSLVNSVYVAKFKRMFSFVFRYYFNIICIFINLLKNYQFEMFDLLLKYTFLILIVFLFYTSLN